MYALRRSLSVLVLALTTAGLALAQDWPSFRGRHASGVADGHALPVTWDAEKSTNIAWKTPIPGLGHSSPIVWENRIFVTTAVGESAAELEHGLTQAIRSANETSVHEWRIYCLNRDDGRVVWQKTAVRRAPRTQRHVKGSQANPTPATDGKHVIVSFGAEGLYCFDFNGKLLWKLDLGPLDGGWSDAPDAHWGFGSSPIIYKDLAIVQCDTQRDSFIAAYRVKDGKQVWRTPRDEDTSWSSPSIFEGESRDELIASGTKYYRGYDPLTGKELWRLADGADVKIPTPVFARNLILLGGGSTHLRRAFYAVRPGANGEISVSSPNKASPHIAWQNRALPHVLTPIVYGEYLYVCADNGVLAQYDIKTGETIYRERLGGRGSAFSASPVAGEGKIYFASEDGDVFVIKAGPEYQLLATNPIGEVIMATPAISNGMLVIRGQHHLFGVRSSR
jgi:outer membrane protein assembly factor BamB